jgi:hypothetical protein
LILQMWLYLGQPFFLCSPVQIMQPVDGSQRILCLVYRKDLSNDGGMDENSRIS